MYCVNMTTWRFAFEPRSTRSLDLNSLDFCLCSHIKRFLCTMTLHDVAELQRKVTFGCQSIRNVPRFSARATLFNETRGALYGSTVTKPERF
jgi:hypothetical protein